MAEESSESLFRFETERYLFLITLGFSRHDRRDEVEFRSGKLTYRIGLQRWGEPAKSQLEDAQSGQELPSPLTALQYFLDDYDGEWARTSGQFKSETRLRASIATVAALCGKNPWIFTSTEWAREPGFAKAKEETEKWFRSTTPLPSAADVLNKLRSFRT
jgi:hypothetical protein